VRVPASLSLGLAAFLWTAQAEAQHVSLAINDGAVTLDARGVTVPQILAEWTRVGGVRIINAEKIVAPPVTMLLRDVTERQALDILLRDAGGYLLFARRDGMPGSSAFEQILVVPVSTAPQARPTATGARADLAPYRRAIAGAPLTVPLPQAAGDDQPAVDTTSDDAGAQETPGDDPTGADASEVGARPPTPSLPPPPPPPDPGNPFGSAGATARPGIAAPPPGPPPGVIYPPVTNPNLQQGAPGPILR